MDLDDLKKSFLKKSDEERLAFIRELRYNRTIDNSPPKIIKTPRIPKEKKPKKDPFSSLNLSKEETLQLLELLQKELL